MVRTMICPKCQSHRTVSTMYFYGAKVETNQFCLQCLHRWTAAEPGIPVCPNCEYKAEQEGLVGIEDYKVCSNCKWYYGPTKPVSDEDLFDAVDGLKGKITMADVRKKRPNEL